MLGFAECLLEALLFPGATTVTKGLIWDKKLKFRMLLKVPRNLNMCPDVSGLCPSSVECSLTHVNMGHLVSTRGNHVTLFFPLFNCFGISCDVSTMVGSLSISSSKIFTILEGLCFVGLLYSANLTKDDFDSSQEREPLSFLL